MFYVRESLKDKLVLSSEGYFVEISFPKEDVVRLKVKEGDYDETGEFKIAQENSPVEFQTRFISEKQLKLYTNKLDVNVNLSPLSVVISKDGKVIFQSKDTGFIEDRDKELVVRFKLGDDEKIYGLGQDCMANLDQRGQERRCWHQWNGFRRSGNDSVPFLISSKGYGLFLDTTWPVRFAIGGDKIPEKNLGEDWAPSPWDWDLSSGEKDPNGLSVLLYGSKVVDFYIIIGNKSDEIISNYYQITGIPKLLPKWAYSFIQCKNRYRSEEELLYLAKKFREKGIPGDVLVIDWLWFKEFGDLEWNERYWKDPKKTFEELSRLGFKIMQAQHPFVDKKSLKYKFFKEKGYLNNVPPDARPTFDHSNPEARKAWWDEIKRLYETGIRGYWTDMGELEEHKPGTTSFLGPREKVHNIYTLLWTKGLYENQRKDFGTRSFSLARTFWCGIQRYGVAMWSGDISSSWDVLKDQVVIAQNVSLSGMPYWTTDIGGFFPHPDLTPELYIRWLQWGVFCPIFRTHGTRPENEPWSFGEDAEEIIVDFIKLRYKLIPYIYSLAYYTTKGRQILRPMAIDYPNDEKACSMKYQFMFGDILVSPVLDKGTRVKSTYLPKGYWYDFWTGRRYLGENTVTSPAPMDRIPLFVRAGAIIPTQEIQMYVDEKPLKNLEINIYSGSSGEFDLYEDDGITYEYEDGKSVKTRFSVEEDTDDLRIYISSCGKESDGFEREKTLTFNIYGINTEKVEIKGQSISFENSPRYVKLEKIPYRFGETLEIKIKKTPAKAKDEDFLVSADTFDRRLDGTTRLKILVTNGKDAPLSKIYFRLRKNENWAILSSNLPDGNPTLSYPQGKLVLKSGEFFEGEVLLSPYGDLYYPYDELTLGVIREVEDSVEEKELKIPLNQGIVNNWKVIGIFKDSVEEIEKGPDRIEYNVDGKIYRWSKIDRVINNPSGYIDLLSYAKLSAPVENLTENITQGTAYAKAEIISNEDKEVQILLYGEEKLSIFLNGELIYFRDKETIEDKIQLNLKRGINKILVKASFDFPKPYSGRELGFKMRIEDPKLGILIAR